MSDDRAAREPMAGAETAAETLLSVVPDLAYVLDERGRLRWWNDRLEAVTGYERSELDGARFEDLIAPDDRGRALAAFETVEDAAPSELMELDLLTSDGDRVPYEFSGGLLEEGEEFLGVAGIGREVSERAARREELQRRRNQSETLYYVGEAAGEVIDALVEAGTREALERRVCERIFASERYRAVWVGRVEDGQTVTSVGEAEMDVDEFLEAVKSVDDIEGWTRPAKQAVERNEVVVVHDIPNADVPEQAQEAAEAFGLRSGLAVPLPHRDTVYGVLTVHSARPDAFSRREQTAFRRLGRYVGFAIYAIHTERLLLGDHGTELVFDVPEGDRPLFGFSAEWDCVCQFEWATPGPDGRMRHYISIEGAPVEAVHELFSGIDSVEEYRVVSRNDAGTECLVEIAVPRSQVRRIVDAGGKIQEHHIEGGEARVVITVPDPADVNDVAEAMFDYFPTARLTAKRPVSRPGTETPLHRLTDRQLEALTAAHRAGYFEWPRENDAEAVAEDLGISSATFHYHLRGALSRLFDAMFDDSRQLE